MSLGANLKCQIMGALGKYIIQSSILHFSDLLFVYFAEKKMSSINNEMSSWESSMDGQSQVVFFCKAHCPRLQRATTSFQICDFTPSFNGHTEKNYIIKETEMSLSCPKTFELTCVLTTRPDSHFSLISPAIIVFLLCKKPHGWADRFRHALWELLKVILRNVGRL